ncbi:hypothetical protein MTO96_036213 [Rhipicephalus appendiculatus]
MQVTVDCSEEVESTSAVHKKKIRKSNVQRGNPHNDSALHGSRRREVSVKKQLVKASRLPRLPEEHTRIINRPRGGLDIKKVGDFKTSQAIAAARGVTANDMAHAIICPSIMQNIMIASTPDERNSKAYAIVEAIAIDKAMYEVSAYMAAPNNNSKGVIKGIDPELGQDQLRDLIIHSRNPNVLDVRRIKSTSSVIVLFDGLKVPDYVKCGPSLIKYSLYRRQADCRYACGRLGHGADSWRTKPEQRRKDPEPSLSLGADPDREDHIMPDSSPDQGRKERRYKSSHPTQDSNWHRGSVERRSRLTEINQTQEAETKLPGTWRNWACTRVPGPASTSQSIITS